MGGIDWNEISEKANGGTELMCRYLEKYLDKELLNKYQIVPSRVKNPLDETKHRVFYAHDLPGDPESQHLENGGWDKWHRIVFVSHWQQQAYINHMNLPWHKTAVLQNAIEPIDAAEKPNDVVRIIYHTTPHRGLNILVPVIEKLAEEYKEKIHLDVYSSFAVYGWEERDKPFEELFNKIRNHPNMTYHGAVSNKDVHEALRKAHIFAYPSVWPETSCICLMEAMSAGLLCVHPNYAALPETAANWTHMYQFHEDANAHARTFFGVLKDVIDYVLSDNYKGDVKLKGQKSYADLFYSWDLRKIQWENFLNSFTHEPKELKKAPMFVYKT